MDETLNIPIDRRLFVTSLSVIGAVEDYLSFTVK